MKSEEEFALEAYTFVNGLKDIGLRESISIFGKIKTIERVYKILIDALEEDDLELDSDRALPRLVAAVERAALEIEESR